MNRRDLIRAAFSAGGALGLAKALGREPLPEELRIAAELDPPVATGTFVVRFHSVNGVEAIATCSTVPQGYVLGNDGVYSYCTTSLVSL